MVFWLDWDELIIVIPQPYEGQMEMLSMGSFAVGNIPITLTLYCIITLLCLAQVFTSDLNFVHIL